MSAMFVPNVVTYCLYVPHVSNSTAPTASFAGSMQLLAGVKLCTGRHITNHPHYENKWLREQTVQVYLIFCLHYTFIITLCLKGWTDLWSEGAQRST